VAACTQGQDTSTIAASWTLDPEPPAAGRDTLTRITLRDAAQNPVQGARLRLEGHMSHPGMTPVTTPVVERAPGEYEAQLRFSMAGDWQLVLTGELRDGERVTRQIDVVGVRPAP
jgi:hypothetical protein